MSLSNYLRLALLVTLGCGSALADEAARRGATRADQVRAELERAIASYEQAFNDADAQAIGRLWTAGGVYENRDTGERIVGREAILTDLSDVFQAQPEGQLRIGLERIRLIQPDVARVEGKSSVIRKDRPEQHGQFAAIYVRRDGEWLIDSVEEAGPGSPQTARAALSQLQWMIGRWVDQSDEVEVQTDVRWAPGGSFLIRAYSVTSHDATHRGTQVIGWDPIRQQIRSWVFDSEGAFGEGVWSGSGNEWLVRTTFNTTGGDLVSGTQVITRMGDGRLRVQTVGQEVNGEPQPAKEPVTVVRVQEAPARQSPEVLQGAQR